MIRKTIPAFISFIWLIASCGSPTPSDTIAGSATINCPTLPQTVDSLLLFYRDTTFPDTFRMHALHNASRKLIYAETDSAIVLARDLRADAHAKSQPKWEGNAYILLGVGYKLREEYDSAISNYRKAIPLLEEADHQPGLAAVYTNMGAAYEKLIDYRMALDYHLKSMSIYEELDDKAGASTALSNTGLVYFFLRDFEKSKSYQEQALSAARVGGDSIRAARALSNLGIVYEQTDSFNLALQTHKEALRIRLNGAPLKEIAVNYANIGVVYQRMKNYDSSLYYLDRAIRIEDSIGYVYGMLNAMGTKGEISLETKSYVRGLQQADSVILLSRMIGAPILEKEGLGLKSRILEASGNKAAAYDYYKKYIALRDSINSSEVQNDIAKKEVRFEYEKRMAADSIKAEEALKVRDAQIEVQNARIEQDRTWRTALYTGLTLVIAFAVFAWNRFRVTRRQKNIIAEQKTTVEHQKALVEEKQQEIVDSISYAKRLQDAILPNEKTWWASFKDSFVFYRPKDIVAGDFYWLEKKPGLIFVAAADCTGHGVPGAMVSVVCSNALNRCANEFGLTDPGAILDKARELVINTFIKSEKDVQDGMDISLAVIDTTNKSVTWAGANNPIWFTSNNEMVEVKGDKQPVGRYEHAKAFTSHTITVAKGEMIYLFTDGFADQFGGIKGKKFKYSQLKELLLSVSTKSCSVQKKMIDETFSSWRGNLQQVDDVLIAGIRF